MVLLPDRFGRGATATPACSSAWATRSATSSRQGAAMICTRDRQRLQRHRRRHHRQADERDRLGVDADVRRAAASRRRRARRSAGRCVGATQGVAGARMTSTSPEQSRAPASRYQRRNFCAWTTSDAGTIAPAISRSRTAGSKSCAARAQAVEMQRRAFGRGDDIGRGARALGFGNFDLARDVERLGDARDRLAAPRETRPCGNSRRRPRCAGRRRRDRASAPSARRAGRAQAGSSASWPCMAS